MSNKNLKENKIQEKTFNINDIAELCNVDKRKIAQWINKLCDSDNFVFSTNQAIEIMNYGGASKVLIEMIRNNYQKKSTKNDEIKNEIEDAIKEIKHETEDKINKLTNDLKKIESIKQKNIVIPEPNYANKIQPEIVEKTIRVKNDDQIERDYDAILLLVNQYAKKYKLDKKKVMNDVITDAGIKLDIDFDKMSEKFGISKIDYAKNNNLLGEILKSAREFK